MDVLPDEQSWNIDKQHGYWPIWEMHSSVKRGSHSRSLPEYQCYQGIARLQQDSTHGRNRYMHAGMQADIACLFDQSLYSLVKQQRLASDHHTHATLDISYDGRTAVAAK